jgi:hypothetical protein
MLRIGIALYDLAVDTDALRWTVSTLALWVGAIEFLENRIVHLGTERRFDGL